MASRYLNTSIQKGLKTGLLITLIALYAKSKLKTLTSEEITKATGNFGIPGFKWPL